MLFVQSRQTLDAEAMLRIPREGILGETGEKCELWRIKAEQEEGGGGWRVKRDKQWTGGEMSI